MENSDERSDIETLKADVEYRGDSILFTNSHHLLHKARTL